ELSRLPPARYRTGEKRPSRVSDFYEIDCGKLPFMPRGHLPTVPAQPACRPGMGGRLWRERTHSGTGKLFGNVPARWNAQTAASFCADGRRTGRNERVCTVS